MTKDQTIKAVVAKLDGVTKKDIEAVLDAYSEVVLETLRADHSEKVVFPGVGSFAVKEVAARDGVVMLGENKGEPWHKDACSEVTFKVSKAVKTL